jgi:general secretion pathway protein D
LEVSNIVSEFTDSQGSRSYQIGTRNANTNLRLKDGETQILGGLITDQDRNTASKIPGLGHLPVVGRLFGNNDGTSANSEIVLAITPHIVRNLPDRPPEARNIFSGTLNVLRDKPILAEPLSQLKYAQPAGTGGAAPAAAPAAPGAPVTSQPAPGAGVLFNPASATATGGTGTPSPQGSPLPPPPAMVPRAPASR